MRWDFLSRDLCFDLIFHDIKKNNNSITAYVRCRLGPHGGKLPMRLTAGEN